MGIGPLRTTREPSRRATLSLTPDVNAPLISTDLWHLGFEQYALHTKPRVNETHAAWPDNFLPHTKNP